jgi:hypothetical protein
MMKAAVAMTCFWAGALGSALGLSWYLAVLFARRPIWPFPTGIGSIEALFAVWGAAMFATFYRSPRPIWGPVLVVTHERVRKARLSLWCLLLNSLVWLAALVVLAAAHIRKPLPWSFCAFASSCALLNGSYIWMHWAFRPESLFSEGFRRFADDPLVFAVAGLVVKAKRRPKP